jgi:SAM-dependent methyltransferase
MEAPAAHAQNADQLAYWNGPGGRHWTERQATQDVMLAPVSDVLLDRARATAGERVLDVGCGCGATAIALAARVGPKGHVLGVDISAPMLARARELAPPGAPLEFIAADATIHPFEPASFDLLASRFGVMFFAEPALSFANLRKALRPGARLVFACWCEPRDNPWIMTPLQAVYKHAPRPPRPGPEEPGPFSFASEERVRRILAEAGFVDVAMVSNNVLLDIAAGRGLEAGVETALGVGPAARVLLDQPPTVREAARHSVREVLAPLVKGNSIPLAASFWIVTARAP